MLRVFKAVTSDIFHLSGLGQHQQNSGIMLKQFEYSDRKKQQTGFDNSLDHQEFGHWRNPEYQQLQQDIEERDEDGNWNESRDEE